MPGCQPSPFRKIQCKYILNLWRKFKNSHLMVTFLTEKNTMLFTSLMKHQLQQGYSSRIFKLNIYQMSQFSIKCLNIYKKHQKYHNHLLRSFKSGNYLAFTFDGSKVKKLEGKNVKYKTVYKQFPIISKIAPSTELLKGFLREVRSSLLHGGWEGRGKGKYSFQPKNSAPHMQENNF